jgi:hypothetical protein
MTRCASCGMILTGDVALCPHHSASGDDWAAGNRIACDFYHRKKVQPELREPLEWDT